MARLSLRSLGSSSHPLLERGSFSIFYDSNVKNTDSVTASFDLDGTVLVSRYSSSNVDSKVTVTAVFTLSGAWMHSMCALLGRGGFIPPRK